MEKKENNFAYIDGANLHKGVESSDLVLQAAKDYYENHPVATLLVSSDGDYAPLVRFWQEKKVPCAIISPAPIAKCSILLKRTGAPIIYLEDMKHKLSFKSK